MDNKNLIKLVIGVLIVVIILRMVSCNKRQAYGATELFDEDYADYDPLEMENDAETFQAANPSTAPTLPPMSQSVDLLPKPVATSTDFGEFAPKTLGAQNFLDASKFIGIDTQGSSLRNASYDLRPDPVIPRKDVGAWLNSTIEQDLYRKPLC